MSIQTIAVLGAGAIGSYFIDGLREKLGDHLWVIAEGERAERLKEKGIVVNGETLRLNVRTPEQAHGAISSSSRSNTAVCRAAFP